MGSGNQSQQNQRVASEDDRQGHEVAPQIPP
jgi:hypothetical protein